MRLLMTLCLLLIFTFAGLRAQTGKVVDWDYEIDLLARELAGKHPDLFFRTDSAWYSQAMRQVAREAPAKTRFQVSVRLQQVLAAMGDAQTQVNYHFLVEKSKILPLECYWFEDGIFVLETERAYEAMLGKKLVTINSFPLGVVIDSLSTLLVLDNQSVLLNQVPRMLSWFQLLEYFGFASGNEITLGVQGHGGELLNVRLHLPVELGETVKVQPASMPLGWQDQKAFFRDHYFDRERIYYIQYNRCWSREAEEDHGSGASALFMPSFKEFEKQVYPVLKKKEVEKLVFDIRFNKGGYASQGTDFISKICKSLPRDHGPVYVLTGRATSGSAINNTVDFIKAADVILVGEETSGKPNYFGEVDRFVLPESGLIISYPTRYYSLMEQDLPALSPHIYAPLDFGTYMMGIDPAMEAIRKNPVP